MTVDHKHLIATPGDLLVYALPTDVFWPLDGSGIGATYRIGIVLEVSPDARHMVTKWRDHLDREGNTLPKSRWIAPADRIAQELRRCIKQEDLDDIAMLAPEFSRLQDARDYIINFWRKP